MEAEGPDVSPAWYAQHAERYAQVAAELTQSVWPVRSHPKLTDELAVFERLKELAGPPPKRGFDAGCGAGARDVFLLHQPGYDMTGVDAIAENVSVARQLHPEIAGRLSVADLSEPLPFEDASFDFAYCDSVIQHLDADAVFGVILPQLVRILRPGGVLQMLFKCGEGFATVHDPDYGVERSFHLYDEHAVLRRLEELGCGLVEADSPDKLGGLLYCQDHRAIPICVFWVRLDL